MRADSFQKLMTTASESRCSKKDACGSLADVVHLLSECRRVLDTALPETTKESTAAEE